jgi:predicted acylesterase/phospholipase RssA/CRP-like cAMP-binding protein
MNIDVISLLKVHAYFQGVPDETLQEVARHALVAEHHTGAIVHDANVLLNSVGFVLRGRLKCVRVDARGHETLFRMVERGQQFGLMIGALSEPVPIRIIAMEPSTVLSLDYDKAMELAHQYAELRHLWLTTFVGNLRKIFFGTTPRRAAMVLALIHDSHATRPTGQRLIKRLCEIGEKIAAFSDADDLHSMPNIPCRRLHENGTMLELDEIRRQAVAWQDANRIIFDLQGEMAPDWMTRLMELADRVVYFVPAGASDTAIRRLQALDVSARGWRDKISVAWLLEAGTPVVPVVPDLRDVCARDFKIAAAPFEHPYGPSVSNGLERLVHDLRGIRIGVALGGGAARGMSHLGVLKALEQNGIVVDLIAGTSAGAMTGIVYSAGLDPDYSAASFAADLRPSWLFRQIPHGNHWYLIYKYRRGQFDPMLRKYIHDWRLEQLPVPCLSVTVDLVSGNSVVRERGDATHAILESINLPVLSVPICRNGQALIDGGVVNNIPADVLVSMGCNFVIAVSVSAKMEKQFCDIKPEGPMPRSSPNIVQTLLRTLLVQNYCLNSFGVQPADMVIEPDVTGFDPTEFVRTVELAAVGEAAAREQIPRIKQLLTRLDPQLFRFTSEAASPPVVVQETAALTTPS